MDALQAMLSRADGPDPEALLLIVVGAHLRGELEDRPIANALRDQFTAWLDDRGPDEIVLPIVCTDVWYLNTPELRSRPIVAIGGPDHNAATALLANKLPTALVVDGTYRVHLDPEHVTAEAALWGTTVQGTGGAATAFCERYMGGFLETALVQCGLHAD